MKTTYRKNFKLLCIGLALFVSGAATAQLNALLKGGGIALIVSKFGKDINKGINALTRTTGETKTYSTKVVPVISVGDGKEAGAVQVMGPPSAVSRVQAVGQIEGKFGPLGMRIRGLVPMETRSVTNIKRVIGVGISGLIDVKL